LKSLVVVGSLIAVTCVAMAFTSRKPEPPVAPPPVNGTDGVVSLSGRLSQNKVMVGGDGQVALELTLRADDIAPDETMAAGAVDMVIVLDRSGSMEGRKIADARRAIHGLVSTLTERDRLALVSYSDGVRTDAGLTRMTPDGRRRLDATVRSIYAGGATNLGGGLQSGMGLLMAGRDGGADGNRARVLLISDGLANRGVTDAAALGNMASLALERGFAVSTVGVGQDFNEHLMTAIADRGAGAYHYLSEPNAFAAVFQKEFQHTRSVVAGGLTVRIPLKDGVSLTAASGYPISVEDGHGIFHPGDLRSGQTRKFFLTLRVPTDKAGEVLIDGIDVTYRHDSTSRRVGLSEPFLVSCVQDQSAVFSSIDRGVWEKKVLHEDFNRLKEEVAGFIKAGKSDKAMERIQVYRNTQQSLNDVVQSVEVAENLNREVTELETTVKDTFSGAPSAVMQKQKSNAKALQYEGYRQRRMK
jgi:Ca-activated chloride channel family protein